eukprot:267177-Amphidinium_carterae.2
MAHRIELEELVEVYCRTLVKQHEGIAMPDSNAVGFCDFAILFRWFSFYGPLQVDHVVVEVTCRGEDEIGGSGAVVVLSKLVVVS